MIADKSSTTKKNWEKPQVRTIRLTAEEVLAVGCKMPAGANAVGLPSCGIGRPCSTRGS